MTKKDNRTILITGVTRGLGRAMAAGFIAEGHTVVGCGRSQAAIEELRRHHPAPHRFQKVDVSSDAAVGRWAQQVLKECRPPDLLINNAALINRSAPLWELAADEFDPVIDVNIKGVANVLRHFLPAMVRAKRGVIVNFSSGWGRSTSPEVAAYCATKWAMEGLSKALAEELPAGMAAVPLNPGIIDTEMLRSAFGHGAAKFPTPDQWAQRAVPFLLHLGPKDNGKSLSID